MTEAKSREKHPTLDPRHLHSVAEKVVKDPDGQVRTMRVVDLRSGTLGKDLTYVFEKSIEIARRENKRVTGSSDVRKTET